jgi:hypothetical protein
VATPCPLTDGDLASVDGGRTIDVLLELAAARTLTSVVLRGVESPSLAIQLSFVQEDGGIALEAREPVSPLYEPGALYQPARLSDGGYGIVHRSYLVIPVDAGVPVRAVKLHFSDGLWRAQEISLFD